MILARDSSYQVILVKHLRLYRKEKKNIFLVGLNFKKTSQWIDKYEMKLKNWDKESKESIAVAVCNGAVYEPELKTK